MAITYPHTAAINLTPKPRRVSWTYFALDNVSESPFTKQAQVIRNPAVGVFQIDLAFAPMTRANAQKWAGVFNSLYGSYGTLYIPCYERETILGSGAGSPVVDGAGQTGTSLSLRGMTATQTDVFKAGDMINISSHLYEIQVDVDSDGSGEGTAELWPALRSSYADGTALFTTGIRGIFRQAPGFDFNLDIDVATKYGFGWQGVEAV